MASRSVDGPVVTPATQTVTPRFRVDPPIAAGRDRVPGPVLCVDGGQTGTRAVLLATDGRILAQAEAGPLTHALIPGGRDRLVDALTVIRRATTRERPPAMVFLGLTAITVGTPSEDIGRQVVGDLWPSSARVIENDGIIAWAGSTVLRPGVVAMAGTGSVVHAVNERGDRVQTGGWSYLFGDPGGGWHIGSTIVRQMLQRWDRDQLVSRLGQAVLDSLGASDPGSVADRAYAGEFDLIRIARLTEVVARLASDGDEEARAVLRECAMAFADDAASAIGRLDWEKEPILVATLGGTFRSGPDYRSSFQVALERTTPRLIRVVEPVLSGLGGAALLALGWAGVNVSPRLVDRLLAEGLGAV